MTDEQGSKEQPFETLAVDLIEYLEHKEIGVQISDAGMIKIRDQVYGAFMAGRASLEEENAKLREVLKEAEKLIEWAQAGDLGSKFEAAASDWYRRAGKSGEVGNAK